MKVDRSTQSEHRPLELKSQNFASRRGKIALRHARFLRSRVNSTRDEVAPIQELGVRNCVMGKSGADSRVRVRNRVICAARK